MWSPALVHWPAERRRRERLAGEGIPRLLLVAVGAAVPGDLAEDEDWVRLPAPDADVAARLANLATRLVDAVHLQHGVLRTVRGSTALPAREAAVLQLLLERRGRLVPHGALDAALAAGGGAAGRRVHDVVHRLRRRLQPVGLDIFSTRRRGYLLAMRIDETELDDDPIELADDPGGG